MEKRLGVLQLTNQVRDMQAQTKGPLTFDHCTQLELWLAVLYVPVPHSFVGKTTRVRIQAAWLRDRAGMTDVATIQIAGGYAKWGIPPTIPLKRPLVLAAFSLVVAGALCRQWTYSEFWRFNTVLQLHVAFPLIYSKLIIE